MTFDISRECYMFQTMKTWNVVIFSSISVLSLSALDVCLKIFTFRYLRTVYFLIVFRNKVFLCNPTLCQPTGLFRRSKPGEYFQVNYEFDLFTLCYLVKVIYFTYYLRSYAMLKCPILYTTYKEGSLCS